MCGTSKRVAAALSTAAVLLAAAPCLGAGGAGWEDPALKRIRSAVQELLDGMDPEAKEAAASLSWSRKAVERLRTQIAETELEVKAAETELEAATAKAADAERARQDARERRELAEKTLRLARDSAAREPAVRRRLPSFQEQLATARREETHARAAASLARREKRRLAADRERLQGKLRRIAEQKAGLEESIAGAEKARAGVLAEQLIADSTLAVIEAIERGDAEAALDAHSQLALADASGNRIPGTVYLLCAARALLGDGPATATACAEASSFDVAGVERRMAMAHVRGGHADKALLRFAAARIDADDYEAQIFEARALAQLGRFREALEKVQAPLSARPDDADAFLAKGLALAGLGRHDEAVTALTRAVELAPKRPALRYHLARSLAALGRRGPAAEALQGYLEAKEEAEEAAPASAPGSPVALPQKPDPSAARLYLARLALAEGRTEAAGRHLDRTLRTRGDDPEVLVTAARFNRDMGRPAEARRQLEAALAARPAWTPAEELLASLPASSVDAGGGRCEASGETRALLPGELTVPLVVGGGGLALAAASAVGLGFGYAAAVERDAELRLYRRAVSPAEITAHHDRASELSRRANGLRAASYVGLAAGAAALGYAIWGVLDAAAGPREAVLPSIAPLRGGVAIGLSLSFGEMGDAP